MPFNSDHNAGALKDLGKERENKLSTNTPAKSEKKNPITAKVVGKSIWYGIIVGIFSGWIKMGWENLFPPRTPIRNDPNPPQHMAQQLGIPDDVIFGTVYYNGNPIMPFTLLLHFTFAIAFSFLFILLIQNWRKVAMGQGVVYGLVLWVLWHIILMPLLGTTPAPWDCPFEEHFSECLGHAVWGWSIAVTAYYLINHQKVKTLINFDD
jgi:putative membrane protein